MKHLFALIVVMVASSALFGQDWPGEGPGAWGEGGGPGFAAGNRGMGMAAGMPGQRDRAHYLRAELKAIETELGGSKFGELSLEALKPYRDRLAVAEARDVYVAGLALSSFIMPGSGQFRLGDTGAGAAFLSGHLAVVTAGILGFYFLLPSDLRFNHLNYLDSSLTDISSAWNGHSIRDYLPAAGVAFGSMALDMAIRYWSARSAVDLGRAAVDSGKVKLEPRIFPGFMGLGLSY